MDVGWKETDKIHSRFCKTTPGVPRFSAINVAKLELGRGKVLRTIEKYWLCILRMYFLEIVRTCLEWQINNLKVEDWAKK
jgi:hypothetical protein